MSVSSSIPEDQLPDLSHLTETERNRIMDVLKRDERLNKRLNDKFMQLKQEIDLLESRSVDMPSEHIENATNCARCLQAFGYFFNTGELCPQCGYKVCQSCRVNQAERSGMFFIRSTVTTDKPDWLCILCHKYNEYLMQTGEWIHLGQESRTLKSALRNHLASTSSAANIDAAKLNLSGSQLVKISLFPNKKHEIIQELEQSNFKRSSLSKRYSMIKKAKSNSLTPQMNRDNNDITTSEDALSMISLRSPTTSTRNEVFFYNNEYQHKKQQQSVPSVNVQPPSASTPKSTIFEIPQLSTSQKPKPRNLFFVNQLPPTPASPSTSTPNADNSSVLNRSANLSIKALASNISYQVSKFTGEQSAASNSTLTSYSQDKNESDRKTATATSSQHFISWESSSRSNLRATTASKAEEENFDDDFASVTSSEVDTVSTKSETRLNKLAAAASLASAANKTTTTTTTTTKWQMGRLSDAQANITASSVESSSVGQRLTTTINMSNNSGSNRAVSSLDIAQKKSSAAKLNTTTTTTTTTSGEEANVSHEEKTPERVSLNKRMSTSLGRLIRGRAGSSFKIKNKNNTDNTATNNNNNEQDDEFAQIDQVFAKAKAEKLKNEQQSSSHLKPPLGDKANQNRSQPTLNPGKLFAKNTNNNSDKTASSLAAKSAADLYEGTREMSVDPEEEYLKQATNNDNTNKSGGGNGNGNRNLANKFHTFNYRTMPGRIKYDNSMSTKMEKSESLKSVNETVDSNITVRGKLKLQVTYETLSSNLSVHISACENLASLSNKKEICDPYVKVYLMPGKDKNSKRKTSTKKSTINPIFEETLRYTISSSKLASHKLWISVWHHDKFGKNKFLGEIMIPLDADHLKPFAKLDWHELEPKKDYQ